MSNYWQWFNTTGSVWWHDSGNPDEISAAIQKGAQGVTTNPVLTYKTFIESPDFWKDRLAAVPKNLPSELHAEELLKIVVTYAASELLPIYESTDHKQGYALGQLNPNNAGDAEEMLKQAYRIKKWGPNVMIKLPATKAGIEVLEELASSGTSICASVNVSVAQAMAVAEAFEKGYNKAIANGVKPGVCIIVQQIGRIEDYMRLMNGENGKILSQREIDLSGVAITKKTISLVKKQGYHGIVMPAGLRTPLQLAELAGANVIFTLHPRFQKLVEQANMPREIVCDKPVDSAAIERLLKIEEFRRMYDENALFSEEFIKLGCVQKVLSHFLESGWARLETYMTDVPSEHWT
ncbi:transaldolase family protein [Petroclostridium sp. X23]|uniref:transaldolase family protein n=1 Tax=Petroclostridium sp. X23 TaxID=3045146 RepID=UPI0024ACABE8|nr:transaldolase family protein [Petroclostridium sp. X23]WHH59002.1 transaldolase family protein [Petroclostridium sp. X23]